MEDQKNVPVSTETKEQGVNPPKSDLRHSFDKFLSVLEFIILRLMLFGLLIYELLIIVDEKTHIINYLS